MAVQTIRTGITEEELLRLGAEDQWIEVVNGEIMPMNPVGVLHHLIGGILYDIVNTFVKSQNLGFVFMDGLIYVLEKNAKGKVITSRVSDISFVRAGRFPKFDLRKPFPGAPDLAVEVISPNETAESILDKVRDYLKFGSEQVWVLYPDQRELHQHVSGEGIVHVYRVGDAFSAPTLFPGLQISIKEVFALPDFDQQKEKGA